MNQKRSMMNKYDENKAYEKVKNRVEQEKGFYSHATAYVFINIAIFFFTSQILTYAGVNIKDYETQSWTQWQTFSSPILWGIGLLIHGVWVFREKTLLKNFFKKSILGKDWEERKLKEFMNDDKF